jgi:hypothetical protein
MSSSASGRQWRLALDAGNRDRRMVRSRRPEAPSGLIAAVGARLLMVAAMIAIDTAAAGHVGAAQDERHQ